MGTELNARVGILERRVASADERREQLAESEQLALGAVNAALRLFSENPTDKQQGAVDRAKTRLAALRKALHTSDSATELARRELQDLQRQQKQQDEHTYQIRVQQHAAKLQAQLPALVKELAPLILKLSETVAFVDGIDPAVQDLDKMIAYQCFGGTNPRTFKVEHINRVKKRLRDE
jgi:hypothetical protein